MNDITIRRLEDEDLAEVLTLAEEFQHVDHFRTIIHGSINYVMVVEGKIVGLSSCFRSKTYWSFHIFNIDIENKYATEEAYKYFIEYIVSDLHREGGYTITMLCYTGEDLLIRVLEECGFSENLDSESTEFKSYIKKQPVV